jgi:hypothetical protein
MKFNVTTTFSLETEVTPDGVRLDGNADEFSDNSYWDTYNATVNGGEVMFVVEAEDEDAAEEAANDVIWDGMEVEDNNGFTWVVTDLSREIEAIEMSKETALAVVQRLLMRLTTEGVLTEEEREAFDVILQDV